MNAFYTKASLFDPTVFPNPSEQDFNINTWEPIIEALFSNPVVKIKSGDTMLLNLNGKQKIDYRLDTIVNQRLVDAGKIEPISFERLSSRPQNIPQKEYAKESV